MMFFIKFRTLLFSLDFRNCVLWRKNNDKKISVVHIVPNGKCANEDRWTVLIKVMELKNIKRQKSSVIWSDQMMEHPAQESVSRQCISAIILLLSVPAEIQSKPKVFILDPNKPQSWPWQATYSFGVKFYIANWIVTVMQTVNLSHAQGCLLVIWIHICRFLPRRT
jgi:hypothetical protein